MKIIKLLYWVIDKVLGALGMVIYIFILLLAEINDLFKPSSK